MSVCITENLFYMWSIKIAGEDNCGEWVGIWEVFYKIYDNFLHDRQLCEKFRRYTVNVLSVLS